MATHSSPASQAIAADVPHERPQPLRLALLLFLFLNCVYLLTSTGKVRTIDEIDPVLQSESLLLRHSTAIPQAVNSGIYFGKLDRQGNPRSAWPFGHAVLILPWSAVGHLMAQSPAIPRGITDLAISTADCWSNATYAALAVAAMFLIFFKIAEDERTALMCSLVAAFATPLFVYSGWMYSEPVSTALFLTAAFLLFGTGTQPEVPRAVAGSLLLGFAIHVRPADMVTVFVFIAAAMVMESAERKELTYRTTAILLVVMAISGALYLARNYAFFSNPFDFGVPATAENGKDLESWHNPFWRGVFGFLFSPGKSVFLFCPPMVLGILGLPRLWRKNRALTVLAAGAPVANLCLYAFRTQWEGSYCYGPRYLVPSLMLLCLPMAALLRNAPRWVRPVFWVTTLGGFAVQTIGLSANVLEDMLHNHYYNAHWDYQMGYSPIPGQLHLIWKYLHVEPTAVGWGWDRWFLFLRNAGASPALINGLVACMAAGALLFGLLMWRSLCEN